MPLLRTALHRLLPSSFAALLLIPAAHAQDAPSATQPPAPIVRQAPEPEPTPQAPPAAVPSIPKATYDRSIFQNAIPPDQLAFLAQFAGAKSKDVMKDKQFRKLMKLFVPDTEFHYGRDMSLHEAIDNVIEGSSTPVQLRDNRYLLVSGAMGAYLSGRGFLWLDLQEGIGLGGFYFQPTNGEPTPAVNIFSRQVKEQFLSLAQLPPAFAEDLSRWQRAFRVGPVTTRYFITGNNKKILLEHDEDFCAPSEGSAIPPKDWCEQMNADAADLDLTAAYYVEQTHHATNATAWMISGEQLAWVQTRNSTCGAVLGCRIAMTRVQIRTVSRPSPSRPRR